MRIRCSTAAVIAPWLVIAILLFILSTSSAYSKADPVAVKIEPSQINATELAEELGVSAWSFNYSARLSNVWVEIIEGEKKTLLPPNLESLTAMNARMNAAQKARNRKTNGRINLFIKRGSVRLRVSGTYSQGGIAGFPDDGLWWGWKSINAVVPQRPSDELQMRPGDEITLLRYVVTNNDVPNGAQKVEVLLKAVLADDE